MNSPDYQDKYYSIVEEENKQKLKLQLEQEKERLKSLMPNITTFNLNGKSGKDDYDHACNSTSTNHNNSICLIQASSNLNNINNKIPTINVTMPVTPSQTQPTSSSSIQQQQQTQQQFMHANAINSTISNNYYLSDANKAFDDVVFDILKVDPDYIAKLGGDSTKKKLVESGRELMTEKINNVLNPIHCLKQYEKREFFTFIKFGQLTLIDVPLFKAIEPDELISCKWMSREKLVKAPNIVHFTRRFNQTTFWAQKEILNCKRIEKRGKMITHFIKMAKRLNELHSFNCLMAIIVALKSAPIYRLKKTWSQHVSKRDATQFERLADLMFDTSDNKRKIRDMHMNVKLPCIPFLGLFLTDLIHIDIAHPHNSFDNPQRRNQMNNICRLISEFQQSNYQDLTSISCSCTFSCNPTTTASIDDNIINNGSSTNDTPMTTTNTSVCVLSNCSCGIHHGDGYGAGIINSDGTIYISEISYVHNYLNSFLYIEELQKFKEDENYRDSLELEPEPLTSASSVVNTPSSSSSSQSNNGVNQDHVDSPSLTNTPNKLFIGGDSQILRLNVNNNNVSSSNNNGHRLKLNGGGGLTSYNSVMNAENNNNNGNSLVINYYHRKSLSLNNNNLLNETKEFLNDLKLRHHPLDDSIVESTTNLPVLTTTKTTDIVAPIPPPLPINSSTSSSQIQQICLNLNLTKEQQKQILNSVKLNDPPSLLKELLKHRHSNISLENNSNTIASQHKSHRKSSGGGHHKNKFNCYSGNATSSDCDCESDDIKNEDDNNKSNQNNNNNINNDVNNQNVIVGSPNLKKLNESLKLTANNNSNNESSDCENTTICNNNGNKENSSNSNSRRISGRNLIQVLNESEKIMPATSKNNLSNNGNNATNFVNTTANSLTTSTISHANNLENSLNSMPNTNDECQINRDTTSLTNNIMMNNLLLQTSIIQFESPIKRKCIIKNFRKPRFSQWKSYWLQLVGGNLLIYYPAKTIVFNRRDESTMMLSQRRNSTNSNEFYTDSVSSAIAALGATAANANTASEHNIIDEELKQQQTQQLQNQLQARKVYYHKNPCKMHPIASWMVVNLYQDKENEIISAINQSAIAATSVNTTNQPNATQFQLLNHTKFDIQLNDLNNGNMYKYRLDSLPLAKEWLEHFKLASTYHERQKPDNLIRFD